MNRRPRRNRKSHAIRSLVQEHSVSVSDLVYPLFVSNEISEKKELGSLPGNFLWPQSQIIEEIEACISLGLNHFMLFPKIKESLKDKRGSYGVDPQNYYLQLARDIKARLPDANLISDLALDPYNSDGHDGIVENGKILNDETVDLLVEMAIAQAEAGFDILGPSDMMDGRVGAIRMGLDSHGFSETSIMSYTAKYASSLYGPFRDALDSAPTHDKDIPSDKKSYQMDPANIREAMIEAELDTIEGADFLMIKPALHYLDVIHVIKGEFDLPVAAYHVSGECAMLIAACKNGWLDFNKAVPETLLCIKRAGADIIITYFAKEYAILHGS